MSVFLLNTLDKRHREYRRVRWVYVARNPSFADSVFKIGQITVSPSEGVAQLGAPTSVYRRFQLAYFVHVSKHLRAEQFVHHTLQNSRLNSGKEFFGASIMTVVRALDEAGERWPIPSVKTMDAESLPPALTKRIAHCPKFSHKSRVPQLLIEASVTCPQCTSWYKVRAANGAGLRGDITPGQLANLDRLCLVSGITISTECKRRLFCGASNNANKMNPRIRNYKLGWYSTRGKVIPRRTAWKVARPSATTTLRSAIWRI